MPSETTEEVICRVNGETGATGLEPATSGVTGQLVSPKSDKAVGNTAAMLVISPSLLQVVRDVHTVT